MTIEEKKGKDAMIDGDSELRAHPAAHPQLLSAESTVKVGCSTAVAGAELGAVSGLWQLLWSPV